ncbi:MAG: hypothetical protein GPJ54_22645 [Candidatus Heimdallarchaeota archaeon]|nr:hypothetical protein [Candidatus Heimdallarchaeota archaeon]
MKRENWIYDYEVFSSGDNKIDRISTKLNQTRFGIKSFNKLEGIILANMFLISIILGYIGYSEYFNDNNIDYDLWILIYEIMRLFFLEASFTDELPLTLNLARFIAPLIVAYTGLKTIFILSRERLKFFRLSFTSNHVIICGIGEKGYSIATDFLLDGDLVVAIDRDEKIENLDSIKALGGIVIIGNASDENILKKAKCKKAKYVICTTGDDETNIEVSNYVKLLLLDENRTSKLQCFVHINKKSLFFNLHKLKSYDNFTQDEYFDLEFFNTAFNTSRILFSKYGIEKLPLIKNNPNREEMEKPDLNITIIGWDDSTENLIVTIGRMFYGQNNKQIRISLLDGAADTNIAILKTSYPEIEMVMELSQINTNPIFNEEIDSTFLTQLPENIDAVFINQKNEMNATVIAIELKTYLSNQKIEIPTFVHLKNDKGIVNLLTDSDDPFVDLVLPSIIPYGLISQVCSKEIVVQESLDFIAKKLHGRYLKEVASQGPVDKTQPQFKEWESLSNYYKNANRYLADHLYVKLRSLNLVLSKETIDLDKQYRLTDKDKLTLSEAEHSRWMASKFIEGWKLGSERNNLLKMHPSLVSWEEIDEDERKKDTVLIDEMFTLLDENGFRLSRSE